MSRYLIVNADDFGLTAGVSRGIIAAFHEGIVTSTTLMVNMPGFATAVALARENPGLATGLHLNLTYGRPLSPPQEVSSLVGEDGAFVRDPRFVLERGRKEEMRAEFEAQTRRFLSTGLPLSHLDTHHHLHLAERVLDLVADLARWLGVPVRCLDERALRARGVEPLACFTKFFGDEDGTERLLALLESLPEGVTEIPCHPGYADAELMALSTLNIVRERELRALTDPRVREAVRAGGIRLTNYVEVRRGAHGLQGVLPPDIRG